MNFQADYFFNENNADLNELESLLNMTPLDGQQSNRTTSTKRCLNDISNTCSMSAKIQRTSLLTPVSSSCENPVISYVDTLERRNARERNRVRQVNEAFDNLQRVTLRSSANYKGSESKRVSKLNILRQAIERIQRLTEILLEDDLNNQIKLDEIENDFASPSTSSSFNLNKETSHYYYSSELYSQLVYNSEAEQTHVPFTNTCYDCQANISCSVF